MLFKWSLLSIGIIFNALANILLKAAARHSQTANNTSLLMRLFLDPYLILGILSFGLALGAYSYSLTKFELSTAYPIMTSVGLIIVSLFSFYFYKESFSSIKILGTALILIGVLFVSKS